MMKKLALVIFALFSTAVYAQVPVEVIPPDEQQEWLESDDPQLAENKRIAYDFWRRLLVAGDANAARELMHEDYIQHNPNFPTGRETILNFFGGREPAEVLPYIEDLVAIVAENDLVTMAFKREFEDPNNPGETYTTTWFDMFRINDGLVTEHWDYGTLSPR